MVQGEGKTALGISKYYKRLKNKLLWKKKSIKKGRFRAEILQSRIFKGIFCLFVCKGI